MYNSAYIIYTIVRYLSTDVTHVITTNVLTDRNYIINYWDDKAHMKAKNYSIIYRSNK